MKESKKDRHVLESYLTVKKAVKHEGDSDINCNWCTWNSPKVFDKRLKESEIKERLETIQIPQNRLEY